MERLEAGVVTREFQTVISVFSLRRIEDEERGKKKGEGGREARGPCRVTRVQRVTNVSDSKLVRSGSFSLVFVVPCKSLVSRNTWNSCVGLRTLSRKPCSHLLLFILAFNCHLPRIPWEFFSTLPSIERLSIIYRLSFETIFLRKSLWNVSSILFGKRKIGCTNDVIFLIKDVV